MTASRQDPAPPPGSATRMADVLVVGAGVVGTAIARTLAQYELSCVLVEAGNDVGTGTTKANTAILHTGFDAVPGTLESRLVRRGARLLADYAGQAGIPLERTGALLVAWTAGAAGRAGRDRGQVAAQRLHRDPARPAGRAARPRAAPGARRAGRAGDPRREHHLPVDHAAGVRHRGGAGRASGCCWTPGSPAFSRPGTTTPSTRWSTDRAGTLRCRWLVNAAGLYSDQVDAMAGGAGGFTIQPRRGELIVYDKLARPLVGSILLPVPTEQTKGVLVAPTVYGNVLLGPTAQDVPDRVRHRHHRRWPGRPAGGRPAGAARPGRRGDHRHLRGPAGRDRAPRLPDPGGRGPPVRVRGRHQVHRADRVAGHRRARDRAAGRGRAAAQGTRDGRPAAHAVHRPGRAPGPTRTRPASPPTPPTARSSATASASPGARSATRWPARCRPPTLNGLRRRTRAMNGRCQGFYCAATVTSLLDGRPIAARVLGRPVMCCRDQRALGTPAPRHRPTAADRRRAHRRGRPGRAGRRHRAAPARRRPGAGGRPRTAAGRRAPALRAHRLRAARPAPGDDRPGLCPALRPAGRAGRRRGADRDDGDRVGRPAVMSINDQRGRNRDRVRAGDPAGHGVPGAAAAGPAGAGQPAAGRHDHGRAAAAGVPARRAAAGPGAGGRGRARELLGHGHAGPRRRRGGGAGHRRAAAAELRGVPAGRGGALAGAGVDAHGGAPGCRAATG